MTVPLTPLVTRDKIFLAARAFVGGSFLCSAAKPNRSALPLLQLKCKRATRVVKDTVDMIAFETHTTIVNFFLSGAFSMMQDVKFHFLWWRSAPGVTIFHG
jgi:hypothetical protein